MEECQKKGKTKAIGVSNFSQAEMERLVKEANIVRKTFALEAEHKGLTFGADSSRTSVRVPSLAPTTRLH